MKRFLRLPLLSCLAAVLLTVTAFADTGPKDQLVVKVENAPEEPYYLDILAEGNYGEDDSPFDGLEWSYSDGEIAALDQDLLEALRAAVPEGWHACTAEGSTGAPMWGDLYSLDFEAIEEIGIPSVIYGPIGKEYHQWTERVNRKSLLEVVPAVTQQLISHLWEK